MSDEDDPFSLPGSGKEWDAPTLRVMVALLGERARTNDQKVKSIEKSLKEDYTTKEAFRPVQRLIYGLASLMLVAVIGAIVNSVLKVHGG